jgi:predicted GNAT family acetyltransferase
MKVQYYKNVAKFLSSVGKYLYEDEALHEGILGMANAIKRRPQLFPKETLWFCSIGTGNEINAAAMSAREPAIIVEYFSGNIKDITDELVKTVAGAFKNIQAVRGGKTLVDAFIAKWCRSQNVKIKFKMEQKLYRLDKVNDVPLSPGRMRVATMAEKELVLDWFHHFHMDVGGEEREGWEATVLPALEAGWVFFWEDGKPVSMATKTMPTDNGMSVGGVYTPPELRGKGYATSCVAELSRNILQSGKKFCRLTTDLANPTSNSIYIKIGYKPIGDNVFCTFSNR